MTPGPVDVVEPPHRPVFRWRPMTVEAMSTEVALTPTPTEEGNPVSVVETAELRRTGLAHSRG